MSRQMQSVNLPSFTFIFTALPLFSKKNHWNSKKKKKTNNLPNFNRFPISIILIVRHPY
jgi:hypothetical protein